MKSVNSSIISVCIPAYNAESTIVRAIKSVISQTMPPLEIIVYNDGSTDGTIEVIIESGLPIKLINNNINYGVSHARNALIHSASGHLIAFLDADDIWHCQYLEIQFKQYFKYPEAIGYITGFSTMLEGVACKCMDQIYDFETLQIDYYNSMDFIENYFNNPFKSLLSFTIFKTSILKDIYIPEMLQGAEDTFLFYNVASAGSFTRVSTFIGGIYNLSPSSLSQDSFKMDFNKVLVLKHIYKIYKKYPQENLSFIVLKHYKSAQRSLAKYYMGKDDVDCARKVLLKSIISSFSIKTFVLLILIHLPKLVHPTYPSPHRNISKIINNKIVI